MRVVVALIVGWDSPAKLAIDRALEGASAAVALAEIDRLPALRRRKVLACIGALSKAGGR
jgi:serine/threonine protein kinase HipA of HipAB toxin-antitoxin module